LRGYEEAKRGGFVKKRGETVRNGKTSYQLILIGDSHAIQNKV